MPRIDLSDQGIFTLVTNGAFIAGWAWLIAGVVFRLRKRRPGLEIGMAIGVAFGFRVAAALGVSQTGKAASLRGPDEQTWLAIAEHVRQVGLFSPEGLDVATSRLHAWIIALEQTLGPTPDLALRTTQIGFSVLGIGLLAASSHDLVGPRAASWAAWGLALEPTNVFFSGVLLKEPLLFFAAGLVTFGAVKNWRHAGVTGLIPMSAGCSVAVMTRPYAGWFLVGAAALLIFHSSLHNVARRSWSVAVGAIIIAAVIAALPTLGRLSSSDSLQRLQQSQNGNTVDIVTGAKGYNLALSPVDFSTRQKVATNLPKRIVDVLFKPYPWQAENLSQRLGVIGGLAFLGLLGWLIVLVRRNRIAVVSTCAPFLYPAIALLIAYSLSTGNAGTSFRYRTHLAAFAIVIVAMLYDRSQFTARQRIIPTQRGAPLTVATSTIP